MQTCSCDIYPGIDTTLLLSLIDFEVSSAACFSSSSVLAFITTEYPALANSRAIAFPMPGYIRII
jgi:hypothetical protein